jgi:hypothetical protein
MKNQAILYAMITMILASALIMMPVLAKDANTGENNGNRPSVDCPADNGNGYAYDAWEHNWKCNHPVTIENATTAASYLVSKISSTSEDFTDWNGAAVILDTTYYDMTGKNASYSFDVIADRQYAGYVMVSATRDNYPILEFSKGITPDSDADTLLHAQQLVKVKLPNPKMFWAKENRSISEQRSLIWHFQSRGITRN